MSEYGEPWRIEEVSLAEDHSVLLVNDSSGHAVLTGFPRERRLFDRIVACVNACAECTDAEVAELNDDEAVARMTGEAVVEIFDHLRTEAPPPGEIKPEEMN